MDGLFVDMRKRAVSPASVIAGATMWFAIFADGTAGFDPVSDHEPFVSSALSDEL